jgi:hypothetical protein
VIYRLHQRFGHTPGCAGQTVPVFGFLSGQALSICPVQRLFDTRPEACKRREEARMQIVIGRRLWLNCKAPDLSCATG